MINKKFIILCSTQSEYKTLEKLLYDAIHIEKKITNNNCTIYFSYDTSNDIKEIFLSYISDQLIDLKMYESKMFSNDISFNSHLEYVLNLYKENISNYSNYENYKTIIKKLPKENMKEIRRQFLGKYSEDKIMLETLNCFFVQNQNITKTSKELYIHRNTLLQRIDKFIEETNLDPKIFLEALIIYDLIK